jgi:hypothetical protein
MLGGCPSPNRSVDNSKTASLEDAGPSVADQAPSIGKYQCHWRRGDKDEKLPCDIRVEDGQKTLWLIVGDSALQGRTAATDFGFRFTGTWANAGASSAKAVEADFLNQGPAAYASVLTLPDQTLAKLDIRAE